MTPFGTPERAPYKRAALAYFSLGWSPIPLPAREKHPVPDHPHSFTGEPGLYVTRTQIDSWCRGNGRAKAGNFIYPPGNIALRLPKNVLGIDVDAYEGKAGAATLGKAEAEWGKLPATWVASSKLGSPLSGIRLFRIPVGLAWPGDLRSVFGGGVELIRWDHRYALVAPSLHDKTGAEYFWRSPSGELVWLSDPESSVEEVAARAPAVGADIELPDPDTLPDLPEEWVTGLTGGTAAGAARPLAGAGGGELPDSEVRAWIAARGDGPGDDGVCGEIRKTLTRGLREIRTAGDDGGAHDAARNAAWALIGDAQAGHLGLGKALPRLKAAFLEAVRARRGGAKSGDRVASGEWKRIVIRGVSKVAAEGAPAQEDICAALEGGMRPGGGGRGSRGGRGRKATPPRSGAAATSEVFEYSWDDIGNAQRLAREIGDNARWVLGEGRWRLYDESTGLWSVDIDGKWMDRTTMTVVKGMEAEAELIEDPKLKTSFRKFVRSSAGASSRLNAIRTLSAFAGYSVNGVDFDANRRAIVCANGVVELLTSSGAAAEGNTEGVAFRPVSREDYATISTGVRYVPGGGSSSGDWNKFLDKFLPDDGSGVREWAQKLAGYSLFGANPARVFVIAKGVTSSGKTTFAKTIQSVFGGYGGPFSLALFRDNQDERPRADIVNALPRRLIVTEETSSAWKLHGDQIKRATGAGIWSGRAPFAGVYLEREPAFTPWVATNNPPTIEGADDALRRRIRVIPFLHQIPAGEDDPFFAERFRSAGAAEAILAWVIEGWGMYLGDDTLTDMPPAAAQMLLEVMNEFSEMDECLAEIAEREPGSSCLSSDLYNAYITWQSENGDEKERISAIKFGRLLSTKGIERGQKKDPETGKNTKVRLGIRLREEWQRLAFGK